MAYVRRAAIMRGTCSDIAAIGWLGETAACAGPVAGELFRVASDSGPDGSFAVGVADSAIAP